MNNKKANKLEKLILKELMLYSKEQNLLEESRLQRALELGKRFLRIGSSPVVERAAARLQLRKYAEELVSNITSTQQFDRIKEIARVRGQSVKQLLNDIARRRAGEGLAFTIAKSADDFATKFGGLADDLANLFNAPPGTDFITRLNDITKNWIGSYQNFIIELGQNRQRIEDAIKILDNEIIAAAQAYRRNPSQANLELELSLIDEKSVYETFLSATDYQLKTAQSRLNTFGQYDLSGNLDVKAKTNLFKLYVFLANKTKKVKIPEDALQKILGSANPFKEQYVKDQVKRITQLGKQWAESVPTAGVAAVAKKPGFWKNLSPLKKILLGGGSYIGVQSLAAAFGYAQYSRMEGQNVKQLRERRKEVDQFLEAVSPIADFQRMINSDEILPSTGYLILGLLKFAFKAAGGGGYQGGAAIADALGPSDYELASEEQQQEAIIEGRGPQIMGDRVYKDAVLAILTGTDLLEDDNKNSLCKFIQNEVVTVIGAGADLDVESGKMKEAAQKALAAATKDFNQTAYIQMLTSYQNELVEKLEKELGADVDQRGPGYKKDKTKGVFNSALQDIFKGTITDVKRKDDISADLDSEARRKRKKNIQDAIEFRFVKLGVPEQFRGKLNFEEYVKMSKAKRSILLGAFAATVAKEARLTQKEVLAARILSKDTELYKKMKAKVLEDAEAEGRIQIPEDATVRQKEVAIGEWWKENVLSRDAYTENYSIVVEKIRRAYAGEARKTQQFIDYLIDKTALGIAKRNYERRYSGLAGDELEKNKDAQKRLKQIDQRALSMAERVSESLQDIDLTKAGIEKLTAKELQEKIPQRILVNYNTHLNEVKTRAKRIIDRCFEQGRARASRVKIEKEN